MPLDLIILVTLFLLLFIFCMKKGRQLLISILVSFYPTVFLYQHISEILTAHGDLGKIVVFIALFIISLTVINPIVSAQSFSALGKIPDTLLISIGLLTQLLTLYYHNLAPLRSLFEINLLEKTFTGNIPLIIWLLLPLCIILIIHKKKN